MKLKNEYFKKTKGKNLAFETYLIPYEDSNEMNTNKIKNRKDIRIILNSLFGIIV